MAISGAQLDIALLYHVDRNQPHVVREFGTYGDKQSWHIDGGKNYAGRIRFVDTLAADSAATQAAAVLTALRAGPAL